MTDFTVSSRGFKHYPAIHNEQDGYRAEVRVYESSAAMAPHVWVSVTNLGDGTQQIHLTVEQARQLAEQLRHVAAHHYQLDGAE